MLFSWWLDEIDCSRFVLSFGNSFEYRCKVLHKTDISCGVLFYLLVHLTKNWWISHSQLRKLIVVRLEIFVRSDTDGIFYSDSNQNNQEGYNKSMEHRSCAGLVQFLEVGV